jgi:adenine-specific DNA-methyltransferase
MESVDMTAQNIEKIGALFPNCITETRVQIEGANQ